MESPVAVRVSRFEPVPYLHIRVSVRAAYWLLLIPVVLGVGLAVRYAGVNQSPGETGLAAINLLQSGVIGNPYAAPTGPTAHVSPVHVAFLAAIYGVFGHDTKASRIALGLVSLALYVACSYGVLRFCRVQRFGWTACFMAAAITSVLPFRLYEAVVEYRQWDQIWGAAIILASLMISFDPALLQRRFARPEASLALLTGLAGLLAPVALPSTAAALAITLWTRRSHGMVRAALLSGAIAGAMVAPWVVRNARELGAPVLTRSNFGLELALGNNDDANGAAAEMPQHPHESQAVARHLAAIGEVAFMTEKSRQAVAWIEAHPQRFAELTLRRLQILFVPDPLEWRWAPLLGVAGAGSLAMVYGALRLAALIFVVGRGSKPLLWLSHCALPLAPYVITHAQPRYEYPVFFASVCLLSTAADALFRIRTRHPFGAPAIG